MSSDESYSSASERFKEAKKYFKSNPHFFRDLDTNSEERALCELEEIQKELPSERATWSLDDNVPSAHTDGEIFLQSVENQKKKKNNTDQVPTKKTMDTIIFDMTNLGVCDREKVKNMIMIGMCSAIEGGVVKDVQFIEPPAVTGCSTDAQPPAPTPSVEPAQSPLTTDAKKYLDEVCAGIRIPNLFDDTRFYTVRVGSHGLDKMKVETILRANMFKNKIEFVKLCVKASNNSKTILMNYNFNKIA